MKIFNGVEFVESEATQMIPPLCGNCKFWELTNYGGDGFGYCNNEKLNSLIDSEMGNGIEYPVSPNFGCIHFEVKDGEEN